MRGDAPDLVRQRIWFWRAGLRQRPEWSVSASLLLVRQRIWF
jgi:hypothetical protein